MIPLSYSVYHCQCTNCYHSTKWLYVCKCTKSMIHITHGVCSVGAFKFLAFALLENKDMKWLHEWLFSSVEAKKKGRSTVKSVALTLCRNKRQSPNHQTMEVRFTCSWELVSSVLSQPGSPLISTDRVNTCDGDMTCTYYFPPGACACASTEACALACSDTSHSLLYVRANTLAAADLGLILTFSVLVTKQIRTCARACVCLFVHMRRRTRAPSISMPSPASCSSLRLIHAELLRLH